LLRSVPRVDRAASHQERLEAIAGNVPNPLEMPAGCAFHPRCGFAAVPCMTKEQVLEDSGGGHMVRCARWSAI